MAILFQSIIFIGAVFLVQRGIAFVLMSIYSFYHEKVLDKPLDELDSQVAKYYSIAWASFGMAAFVFFIFWPLFKFYTSYMSQAGIFSDVVKTFGALIKVLYL